MSVATSEVPTRRQRWSPRWAVGIVVALLLGGVLGWVGRTLLAPPAPLAAERSYALVTAEQGKVERTITLTAAAAWAGGPDLVNSASGVLTEVKIASGATVSSGDVAYTVGLAPVVLAAGDIPAFRALSPGLKGAD